MFRLMLNIKLNLMLNLILNLIFNLMLSLMLNLQQLQVDLTVDIGQKISHRLSTPGGHLDKDMSHYDEAQKMVLKELVPFYAGSAFLMLHFQIFKFCSFFSKLCSKRDNVISRFSYSVIYYPTVFNFSPD